MSNFTEYRNVLQVKVIFAIYMIYIIKLKTLLKSCANCTWDINIVTLGEPLVAHLFV